MQDPTKPTYFLPGSWNKIELLTKRAALKIPLNNSEDQKMTPELEDEYEVVLKCLKAEYPEQQIEELRKIALVETERRNMLRLGVIEDESSD